LWPERHAGDAARWLHGEGLTDATQKPGNYQAFRLVLDYEASPRLPFCLQLRQTMWQNCDSWSKQAIGPSENS